MAPGSRSARVVTTLLTVGAVAASLLALGTIQGSEPPLRLPAHFVLDRAEDSPAAVVFRHDTHAAYVDNRCLTCHPQPFSILGKFARISHEDLNAGRSCGICHNGRDATGVEDIDGCTSCHTGVTEPSTAKKPAAVTISSSADSPAAVIFRHATHLAMACTACHPQPFAMHLGGTPMPKEEMLEGGTCGRCHDGEEAFGVDDPEYCETCHAGKEASR